MINRIKLHNFKRFKEFSTDFNKSLNLLIGDNESGKSSILTAIDMVISGSRSKVENYGLDRLFNSEEVENFLSSSKKYEDLPTLFIELYLDDQGNKTLDGKYNSDNRSAHGLRMECAPKDELSSEIKHILSQPADNFPFEYYSISFRTFSCESYTGYTKFFKHLLIDNTQIDNEYATKAYIKTLYQATASDIEKNKHKNAYRLHKEEFRTDVLGDLNSRLADYSFAIRTSSKSNLETDLTIKEEGIDLENRGKGRHCFVKTDFALNKSGSDLDIVLIEEPENHLSHINMKRLIQRIESSESKQIFIATHSNLVSTRLDLRKCTLLNSGSDVPVPLTKLSEPTAKYFMKAPDNNILEYILSSKVILVEGSAEFILMEAFYAKTKQVKPLEDDVHIISVGGTSFKRYLELAKLLGIKTAVIRDNDGNYNEKCVERYKDYVSDDIRVFGESDNSMTTFEILLYASNGSICDELFASGRRSLSVQDYMLANKTDCAFELLDKKSSEINTPEYIKNAITWISE